MCFKREYKTTLYMFHFHTALLLIAPLWVVWSNFGPTWIVEKVDCVWRIEGRAITGGGGNSNLYLIRHVCTLWVCFAVMKEMPIYPGGPRDSPYSVWGLQSWEQLKSSIPKYVVSHNAREHCKYALGLVISVFYHPSCLSVSKCVCIISFLELLDWSIEKFLLLTFVGKISIFN